MDCNLFKTLIDNIDFVGLDTQPLRDLFDYSNQKLLDLNKFNIYISTLVNLFFTNKFEQNSKPEIVKQVISKIDHDISVNINYNHTTNNENNFINSQLMLETLMDIKNELATIKESRTIITASKNEQDFVDDLQRVFVNPIDSFKGKEIQSNINIDETVSNTIDTKLNKLKKLKKGD